MQTLEPALQQAQARVQLEWEIRSSKHPARETREPARAYVVHRKVSGDTHRCELVGRDGAPRSEFAVEVLPSDPIWKRDYSGSVRTLIRDGVDTPLANLFVNTAQRIPEDADGLARARSTTEAFLFRRLDTLTETQGRFGLNVLLPIPFDGAGTLEVDLLCADARLAIEIDGGQHLADPMAYRRDRRKDQFLQENAYFVLRFLAEDVAKNLDAVLDGIMRVLGRQRQPAKAEPLRFVRRSSE